MSGFIQDYAPTSTAAGLTGLAWKGFRDIENIDNLAEKWEANQTKIRDQLTYDQLKANNFKVTPETADIILDRYIRDGRNLAQARLFGPKLGNIVSKLGDNPLHYQMFADPNISDKDIRLHMLQKGFNAAANDQRPWAFGKDVHLPEWREDLHYKNIKGLGGEVRLGHNPVPEHLRKTIEEIIESSEDLKQSDMIRMLEDSAQRQIDLDQRALTNRGGQATFSFMDPAEELPHNKQALGLIEEMKFSLFGGRPGGLSERSKYMAEALRLGGFGDKEISTPSVYRRKVGDLFSALKKYKTPSLAAGGLATVLLASRAAQKKSWWDKLMEKFSSESVFTKKADVSARDVYGAVLPSLALGAGGHMALGKDTRDDILKPRRDIGVTYGAMNREHSDWGVGSGHKEPSYGVKELLEKAMREDPRWKSLNPIVADIGRDTAGRLNPEMYNRKFNAIIDTGLGLNRQQGWGDALVQSHGLAVDPGIHAKTMHYLQTDMTNPRFLGEMGAAHPRTATPGNPEVDSLARAERHHMLLTGPGSRDAFQKYYGTSVYPTIEGTKVTTGSQPALREKALDLIDAPAQSKEQVLNNALKFLTEEGAKSGDTQMLANAKKVRELLGSDKQKYVFVFGSGRGDYVEGRSYDLATELNKVDPKNEIKVITLMAEKYDDKPAMSLLNSPEVNKRIITLPRLAQPDFLDIARQASLNLSTYGASGFSEALASGNTMVLPEKWGKRQFHGDEGMRADRPERFHDYEVEGRMVDPETMEREPLKRKITAMPHWANSVVTPGSLADKEYKLLAKKGLISQKYLDDLMWSINVDQWNEGQQAYFKDVIMEDSVKRGDSKLSFKGGAIQTSNSEDLAKILTDDKLLANLKEGAIARAGRELSKIKVGRKNLVETILGQAVDSVRRQKAMGYWKLGGGLGLLGVGGTSLYKYLKDS